jgi:hypothetical protein
MKSTPPLHLEDFGYFAATAVKILTGQPDKTTSSQNQQAMLFWVFMLHIQKRPMTTSNVLEISKLERNLLHRTLTPLTKKGILDRTKINTSTGRGVTYLYTFNEAFIAKVWKMKTDATWPIT